MKFLSSRNDQKILKSLVKKYGVDAVKLKRAYEFKTVPSGKFTPIFLRGYVDTPTIDQLNAEFEDLKHVQTTFYQIFDLEEFKKFCVVKLTICRQQGALR